MMAEPTTKLVTAAEFAARWRVNEQTVRAWCRDGTLIGATQAKDGGRWRIPWPPVFRDAPADL